MSEERERIGGIRVDQVGDDLVLHLKRGSLGTVGFLIFWLTGWTVACVMLAGKVLQEPSLEAILFGIPFWSSWVFVLGLVIGLIFGFEELRLGPEGLEHRYGVLRWSRTRIVPLGEFLRITEYARVADSETGRVEHGLKIETAGRPIRIGSGLDPDERTSLAERIHRHLETLAPGREIPCRLGNTWNGQAGVEVLNQDEAVDPPSDCRLESYPEWDRLVIVRNGRLSLLGLAGVTFLVLFWDGIVGVFLLGLVTKFEWGLFFFLIPFEAIGIGLIVGWFAVLLAPFYTERWEVNTSGITRRASFLGIGRLREFAASEIAGVEMRRGQRESKWATKRNIRDEGDTPFSLAIVDAAGRDHFAIKNLTEGESRWIGSHFRSALPIGRPLQASPKLRDPQLDG